MSVEWVELMFNVPPSSRSSAVSPLGPMLEGGAVVATYW